MKIGTGLDNTVSSIKNYQNKNYVGWYFTNAGVMGVNYAAWWKWNDPNNYSSGGKWDGIGSGVNGVSGNVRVNELQIARNGGIWLGGNFLTAVLPSFVSLYFQSKFPPSPVSA